MHRKICDSQIKNGFGPSLGSEQEWMQMQIG